MKRVREVIALCLEDTNSHVGPLELVGIQQGLRMTRLPRAKGVANKRLTIWLNLLDATLTKNMGEGGSYC